MTAVKFKRDEKHESHCHGDGGVVPAYVLVDGVKVGVVRKRSEWYGNLGHRGVRYWYYDFFRVGPDGKAVYEERSVEMRDGTTRDEREPLATASTRKACVAEALVKLGHVEAARSVDSEQADFTMRKVSR